MRVVTYNIWNSENGMPSRLHAVADVLHQQKADILCLQEVSLGNFKVLKEAFPDMIGIHDERSDLAVFSLYPFKETEMLPSGMAVHITIQREILHMVNVHLPWGSAIKREQDIVQIQKKANELPGLCMLAGDFNCSTESSVHRFLKGAQSLLGMDACWFDLAESDADMHGRLPENTLDFRRNPRWGTVQPVNTIEISQRFDRIMLRNPYPKAFPILESVEVFGKTIDPETGMMPSDHYGVMAQLKLS